MNLVIDFVFDSLMRTNEVCNVILSLWIVFETGRAPCGTLWEVRSPCSQQWMLCTIKYIQCLSWILNLLCNQKSYLTNLHQFPPVCVCVGNVSRPAICQAEDIVAFWCDITGYRGFIRAINQCSARENKGKQLVNHAGYQESKQSQALCSTWSTSQLLMC